LHKELVKIGQLGLAHAKRRKLELLCVQAPMDQPEDPAARKPFDWV